VISAIYCNTRLRRAAFWGLSGKAEAWHHLFVLRMRKTATNMTTRNETIATHIHAGIFAIQDKGSVSSGAPFGGDTGVVPGCGVSSVDGGEAMLNDMTFDHWPSSFSPVAA